MSHLPIIGPLVKKLFVYEDEDENAKKLGVAGMKPPGMKKGGSVKKAKGGSVKSSASKRADGCAQRGKTRGKMV